MEPEPAMQEHRCAVCGNYWVAPMLQACPMSTEESRSKHQVRALESIADSLRTLAHPLIAAPPRETTPEERQTYAEWSRAQVQSARAALERMR